MHAPPDYTFDEERLAALGRAGILDTPSEAGFDDIVQLVSRLCEVPVALVSLVAADRQWFKARVGFARCQTEIEGSVCAFVLTEPDLLVIPDLTLDSRTSANPLVTGEPHIRFYAGAPLRLSTGEVLGSLCAIDTRPRPGGLTEGQAECLRILARQVVSQLDLRRALTDRDDFVIEQRRAEARRNALLRLGDHLRDVDSVAEMTRVAAAIVGQTLDVSRTAFCHIVDDDGGVTIEQDWTAEGVASIAGRHRLGDLGGALAGSPPGEPLIVGDVLVDPRMAADRERLNALGVEALVHMPVREQGRTVAFFLVHARAPRAWAPEVVTFLRNVADRVELGVARLKAEARQRVLNQELSHRMKNSFAMVQAIASQTLRSIPDREPVEAFARRLHTLSTAHDLLLRQNWSAAKLDDVIRAVLRILAESERFELTGPAIDLGPRATLSVSLLLHELTTNALKHGALSVAGGRVVITWHLTAPAGEGDLVFAWRETGGPPVEIPKRKGFGSRLIRSGLIGTGGVDLRYLPTGFEADFKASLAQVRQS